MGTDHGRKTPLSVPRKTGEMYATLHQSVFHPFRFISRNQGAGKLS
jgi:hypothetical protein